MARSLLGATLSPMVALWLAGRCGDDMRMAAEVYARRGQGDVARQFLAAVGQMEAAAAQLSNEAVAEAVISVSGNAETEMTAVLGASELSTSEAAKRLGRTRERVVQMLNAGELLGRKVGRAWLVDAQSVDDVLEARRAA
ncbi:helix-turn-helix domain-containing protein [Kribbella deserti]|uniref:Helix-turn-helix domain-containing protein n=2 Tax=Kribbella deserti TaxID=1926257 RepID=A0ABV6QF12_9ACTN